MKFYVKLRIVFQELTPIGSDVMFNVYSEIGKLKTVLLHRPGKELENLTPSVLKRLLFDEIPYLDVAQKEHDTFAEALRKEGVEVLYIVEMVAEALEENPEVVEHFINQFIEEANVKSKKVRKALFDYLDNMSAKAMVQKMIEGIRTKDVIVEKDESIMDMLEREYPFYTDPMPNILFQRDPFATIGRGVSVHKMNTSTRQRETIFSSYMLKYHPRFQKEDMGVYFNRYETDSLEGGDILVLDEKTLAIGISERTNPYAIERLAKNLFAKKESFVTILAFNIPKTRAFMHLDTVFTQVDDGIFTIHPGILDYITVFEITQKAEGRLKIQKVVAPLKDTLEKHLDQKIELIKCGGEDVVASEREQWSDGANTLAIAPGKVIAYSRNYVTNNLLREKGIKVIEIPSSELSRGRGGPRCMSMPIIRENLMRRR